MEAVWQSVGMLFSLEALLQAVTNPVNWGIIGTLVLLEGLLSADNALVLAMMVKHLPEEQRKKALYGILTKCLSLCGDCPGNGINQNLVGETQWCDLLCYI